MIEKCITSGTPIFDIYEDNPVNFNIEEIDKFNKIAELISKETGIPKNMIYTAPYYSFIYNWHKIKHKWYFFKTRENYFEFTNELIGELISEYFTLKTIHYQVARLNCNGQTELGVVSENFCQIGANYKTSWDVGLPVRKDLTVFDNLRFLCPSDDCYKNLLIDIKRFFTRDFYTMQCDRSGNNFLFEEINGILRLAPLYDYEDGFKGLEGFYRNQIGGININDTSTVNRIKKDDCFKELFYKIIDINIHQILCATEDKHKIIIPKDLKDYYINKDRAIKEVTLKSRIIR